MRITYAGRCTCRAMPTRGKFESEDAAPVVDDNSRRCSVDAAHSPPHTENGTLITNPIITLAPAVVRQTGDARRDDSESFASLPCNVGRGGVTLGSVADQPGWRSRRAAAAAARFFEMLLLKPIIHTRSSEAGRALKE